MSVVDYKKAGIDIHAGNEAVERIKKAVKKTFSPHVLTDIGSFGALYDLKSLMLHYDHPVLVQSIDGVGTKMIIARMMNQYDTIGRDVVSAATNDIVVLGAKPLTLLDYIANSKLDPLAIEQIVEGMALACVENGISLIGGETAEMPGTYLPGEYDLVGVVTGVVEKNQVILGKDIVPGDVVFGVNSSGLHTNGYSLARKLFFEVAKLDVSSWHPELGALVGDVLIEPHLNYTRPVQHLLKSGVNIKGMAHITGGGFIENIPRVLPKGCGVEIQKNSWEIPPVFSVMQQLGQLPDADMFHTFNMGIGLIIVLSQSEAQKLCDGLSLFPEFGFQHIGQVVHSETEAVRIL